MTPEEFRRWAPRLRLALIAAILVNVLVAAYNVSVGQPEFIAGNLAACVVVGMALWIVRQREKGRL